MPPAGPQAPGWTRPAQIPPAVAGWGDNAAAPGKTTPPEMLIRDDHHENGKWQRKSLGKDGKFIMVIFLE